MFRVGGYCKEIIVVFPSFEVCCMTLDVVWCCNHKQGEEHPEQTEARYCSEQTLQADFRVISLLQSSLDVRWLKSFFTLKPTLLFESLWELEHFCSSFLGGGVVFKQTLTYTFLFLFFLFFKGNDSTMFANFSQNKMLHNLKQSVSCTFFASPTTTNKEETGWFLQTGKKKKKKRMFRHLKLSLLQFFSTVSAEP